MTHESWASVEDVMLPSGQSIKKGTQVTVLLGNVDIFIISNNIINADDILWS